MTLYFLLSFTDFLLLMATQIHGAASGVLLLHYLWLVYLLEVLMDLVHMGTLHAVAARGTGSFLLEYLMVLL